MPIFWRYLLKSYFRVFFLSISAFVAILLITRLKGIARFAALGSNFLNTSLFTLYQIPHILPIAIPISCLISATLLFQRLSRNYELTAFRSCGLALKDILTPLFMAAFVLSFVNFYISSEMTTRSRIRSRAMLFEETTENPLILLQRQKLLKIKNSYVDMDLKDNDKMAENVIFITQNSSNDRLTLMNARSLFYDNGKLMGHDVALISNIESNKDEFDTLIIENQSYMSMYTPVLSQLMKKGRFRPNTNALPLRMLLLRSKFKGEFNKTKSSIYNEVARRSCLALATLTFTVLGSIFGIEITRGRSKKSIFWILALSILVFVGYLVGKGFKHYPVLACFMFLLPHAIVLTTGGWKLNKIAKGFE